MPLQPIRRKQKRAIVLGCGPAGMFATHALIRRGMDVQVLSKKRRSEMFGAQYLHQPIPDLDGFDQPHEVNYNLWGTSEQYAKKVYGSTPPSFVSPAKLRGKHPAWDIRRAYYDAFARYAGLITHTSALDMDDVNGIVMEKDFDLIVSTIPAIDICTNLTHVFRTQAVWAIGDAPERGVFCPVDLPEMTVVCNGADNPGWYRASNVFGYRTVEWPEQTQPPIPGVAGIHKPTGTTCDCWNGKVIKVGRFGTWDKGAFSHDAYYRLEQ